MINICRICRNNQTAKAVSLYVIGELNAQHRTASTHTQNPSEYCMDTVRKYDYENFLCALLLPKEARSSVFAIRAFNVEVAQIRDIVSDPNIGMMRIQFWRDSLEEIYKDKPPHTPVAMELAKAIHRHKLAKRWLTDILYSRKENLNDRAFMNLKQAEDYAQQAVSSVLYLTLQCLGVTSEDADHAASHIGRCQGLVNMLRAVPFNANRGRCYLPMELLMTHKVSQEDIVRGCREQKMKDLVFDIAGNANVHLEKAREMKAHVPKEAHRAFLQSVSCSHYLSKLQQADFDLFHPSLQQRNYWLPLSLWWTKTKRTY